MARGYALIDKDTGEILARTASFEEDAVSETVDLDGNRELKISGEEDGMRELQERLQEALDANVAKEVFLSNMSHDIRTPMNAIIGMTALAKNHIDEKSRVLDSLNKIEVAGSHLLSLINEVLDMSRINSNKLKITEESFALGDLLHETLVIVRPQAEQKGHRFLFTTSDILEENLIGDTLRLRQIMVNIINNAVKYTNDGGLIQVSVSQKMEGERCVLHFVCEDNGIGMSEDFVKRIFDPFERASNTTISRIEGSGLGMSIVKKLIEAMDGTIEIESQPGKGTKVSVAIPMVYEDTEVKTEKLEGKRILILEDQPELIDTYRNCFEGVPLSYKVVSSTGEVLSALTDAQMEGGRIDLLLLGNTSESNANILEVASYIRKADGDLPMILVGDQDWNEIEYRAGRAGIDRFLPLPLFRNSLYRALYDALEKEGSRGGSGNTVDLKGKHILLVEDNFINREIAKEILSATRAEVDEAENGEEACEKVRKSEEGYYDMILMDIQMPVMDGYKAAETIRSMERRDAQSLPIYAMTANTFAEDVAKARESGMNGHIAKPIDIQKLMNTLRQIS